MDPEIDDEERLGPAMRRLTSRQRRFVVAALEFPGATHEAIARRAGYSASTSNSLKVQAHDNFASERVIAALHEEASKRLRSSAVLGASVLVEIAQDKGHKDRLRAAEALLNRIGFHELSEHRVSVQHSDATGKALTERIAEIARRLGVDPAKLLGVNAVEAPAAVEVKLLEGEVVHVDATTRQE